MFEYLEMLITPLNRKRLLKNKVQNCKFETVQGAAHNEKAWSERIPKIFDYLF